MPSEASAGALFPGAKFLAGNFPFSVADLNGDAVPDLVTANQGINAVSVLLGNSTFPPVIQVDMARDRQIETTDPESGHIETEGGPR